MKINLLGDITHKGTSDMCEIMAVQKEMSRRNKTVPTHDLAPLLIVLGRMASSILSFLRENDAQKKNCGGWLVGMSLTLAEARRERGFVKKQDIEIRVTGEMYPAKVANGQAHYHIWVSVKPTGKLLGTGTKQPKLGAKGPKFIILLRKNN